MGFTIGMPSLKLKNVGAKSKHCGNFRKVAAEALKERQGVDYDLDHSKSWKNLYYGFDSAESLINYSETHIKELNDYRAKNGKTRQEKRKLREDTVVMCATIIKPPAEMMSTMSEEDQVRFLNDALDFFESIVGKDNVKAVAIHFDERVAHMHIFWEPMVDKHKICAREMFNLKFFSKLNREMPVHLRKKGWNMIDDCQMYNKEEEAKKKEELGEDGYREYLKKKRAKNGKESKTYKYEAEKERKEIKSESEKNKIVLINQKQEIAAQSKVLEELDAELKEKKEKIKKENLRLEILTDKVEAARDAEFKAQNNAAVIKNEIMRKKEELETLTKRETDAKAETEKAEKALEEKKADLTKSSEKLNAVTSELKEKEEKAKLLVAQSEKAQKIIDESKGLDETLQGKKDELRELGYVVNMTKANELNFKEAPFSRLSSAEKNAKTIYEWSLPSTLEQAKNEVRNDIEIEYTKRKKRLDDYKNNIDKIVKDRTKNDIDTANKAKEQAEAQNAELKQQLESLQSANEDLEENLENYKNQMRLFFEEIEKDDPNLLNKIFPESLHRNSFNELSLIEHECNDYRADKAIKESIAKRSLLRSKSYGYGSETGLKVTRLKVTRSIKTKDNQEFDDEIDGP